MLPRDSHGQLALLLSAQIQARLERVWLSQGSAAQAVRPKQQQQQGSAEGATSSQRTTAHCGADSSQRIMLVRHPARGHSLPAKPQHACCRGLAYCKVCQRLASQALPMCNPLWYCAISHSTQDVSPLRGYDRHKGSCDALWFDVCCSRIVGPACKPKSLQQD